VVIYCYANLYRVVDRWVEVLGKACSIARAGEWVVVKNLKIEQQDLIACAPFEMAVKNN
jgi:hypothetical protein